MPSSPLWYVSLFINLTWWVECCQDLGHLILPLHSNTLKNMFQTVKEMYTSKSEMSQFSQPWWFHKAFAINGGWWSPGFVRARIGICSKISLSTQSLNCWTGVWNNSRTFYNYLKHSALSAFSLFEEHAQAGFVGVLPVPLKHYIAQGNDAKDCFGITGYSVHHKIRSQLQRITYAILSRNDQSPSVSNSWSSRACEILKPH